MRGIIAALGLAALTLGGCATGGPATPPAPPSLVADPGQPAPPHARLYADCIAQSIAANTYDRERNLLRFHCNGQPAAALNANLAMWVGAGNGATRVNNGTRFNLSSRIEHDLYGVDYCTSVAYNMDEPRCTITLNVGEFLSAP